MDQPTVAAPPFRDHLAAAFDRIELAHENNRGDRTAATPAEAIGPFEAGALTVITSAEPAIADRVALTVACHFAAKQTPTVLANPAADATGTVVQMVAAEGHLDLRRLTSGATRNTDWPKVSKSLGRLAPAPVVVIDDPSLDSSLIERAVGDLSARQGDAAVVVMAGHLLLAATPRPTRAEELTDLAVAMKRLARYASSPIVMAFTTPDPGVGRDSADTHVTLESSDPPMVHAAIRRSHGSTDTVAFTDLPTQSRVVLARPG